MVTNGSSTTTLSEQKAQKSFGLHDSRDMLAKLRWELQNLFCRQRYDIAACKYHAFNCAVTAWHVTDWLWQDISLELKNKKQWKRIQDFQRDVRKECPALALCYEVGRGSKHCLVDYNPAPAISAAISGGVGYADGNPIIVEGDTLHMADKVFYEAQIWLEVFLRNWNIFPEEPFVPMGDSYDH